MRPYGVALSIALLLVAMPSAHAYAQQAPLPSPHRPLPGTASSSLTQLGRWFELDAPFSRRLALQFDTRPVPTFEPLRLPTFESRGLLLHRGLLDLSLFERVAPAVGLDCGLTCNPFLEHSLGFDARAALGGLGKRVPEVFLFHRNEVVRLPTGFNFRSLLGVGGLLDL